MKKLLGVALVLGLAASPVMLFAGVGGGNADSNWTIYGWQNWAIDFRSVETTSTRSPNGLRERDVIKMENEAANIGFAASIDTGMSMGDTPIKANFQCEQFTFHNRNTAFTHNSWCTRNSKLGLSGPWGEFMVSGWLTPYNEVTAQWIDPFYDAGSHTHSTLLGLVGFGTNYGNSGFDGTGYEKGVGGQGFMRRKANLFQWFSPPTWGGLHVRIGWSNDYNNGGSWFTDEVESAVGVVTSMRDPDAAEMTARHRANALIDATNTALGPDSPHRIDDADKVDVSAKVPVYKVAELNPEILSIGASYTTKFGNDELWVAIGYQQHDEWAAAAFQCDDSDDQTVRYAARYIKDWGNGHSTRLSVAYEDMEYDWESCRVDMAATNGGVSGPFDFTRTGGMVDFERTAWLFSGKHDFPGPLDFRFMYMEADDFECGSSMTVRNDANMVVTDCAGINEDDSGAEAFSIGVYYTFPAGTELRLVYGEVDNDDNSRNGFGINSSGVRQGGKEESWQVGMVQWF